MEFIKKLNNTQKIILIILIALICGIIAYAVMSNNSEYEEQDILEQNTIENKIENNIENKIENNIENEKRKIVIHITGQVKNPGLVYLDEGARIADAIKEAGGSTKDAALDKVNLAYVLEDGQKIYIPNKNEKISEIQYIITDSGENVLKDTGKESNVKGGIKKVNINSANQEELETLPGVGPALAVRIIEYRNSNGKFEKVEDVQNVKGIGDSKFTNIKEYICI